jgi:hypothetical protein
MCRPRQPLQFVLLNRRVIAKRILAVKNIALVSMKEAALTRRNRRALVVWLARHNNLAAQHDRVCVPAITNSVLRDAFIKQLSSTSPAKKIYTVLPHPRSKVI